MMALMSKYQSNKKRLEIGLILISSSSVTFISKYLFFYNTVYIFLFFFLKAVCLFSSLIITKLCIARKKQILIASNVKENIYNTGGGRTGDASMGL